MISMARVDGGEARGSVGGDGLRHEAQLVSGAGHECGRSAVGTFRRGCDKQFLCCRQASHLGEQLDNDLTALLYAQGLFPEQWVTD